MSSRDNHKNKSNNSGRPGSEGDRKKKASSSKSTDRKPYGSKPGNANPGSGFGKTRPSDSEKTTRSGSDSRTGSSYRDRNEDRSDRRRPVPDSESSERKPYRDQNEPTSQEKPTAGKKKFGDSRDKNWTDRDEYTNKPVRKPGKRGDDRPIKEYTPPMEKPVEERKRRVNARGEAIKPYRDSRNDESKSTDNPNSFSAKPRYKDGTYQGKYGADKKKSFAKSSTRTLGNTRLNKYIANSGICSRREADELIATGLIEVNGVAVTEMGYQVKEGDRVTYAGEKITPEKPMYILMNKPKDYTTTLKEAEGRRTIMSLVRGAGDVRVFPVGRLDTDTTGLILLTNDGALTKKLNHPSSNVKKLYHVHLNKNLKAEDLKALQDGITLEDGPTKADEIEYVSGGKDKKQVGIEIHSGKNRLVRRMFEQLGYEVVKLDRVMYAGLTKKDLPRGKCRNLNAQELNTLRMLK